MDITPEQDSRNEDEVEEVIVEKADDSFASTNSLDKSEDYYRDKKYF